MRSVAQLRTRDVAHDPEPARRQQAGQDALAAANIEHRTKTFVDDARRDRLVHIPYTCTLRS